MPEIQLYDIDKLSCSKSSHKLINKFDKLSWELKTTIVGNRQVEGGYYFFG